MAKAPAVLDISPAGKLFIDRAAEVRSILMKAFSRKGDIVFVWDGVEDVDLPVIQLLYAARKEAFSSGRTFRFRGTVRDRVSARLVAAGFIAAPPISGEELESGLVDF